MVKNEARWLWYSVTSVIDHIDKLLLWDTGSTDGSVDIERELVRKYPNKIFFKQREQNTSEDFTYVRQEMLNNTKSDWFIMLDGDEIWWQDSIQNIVSIIKNDSKDIESIVVPTVNVVGDIFHYQDNSAGMYNFGTLKGHYNLRAVKTNIPGLHSQGVHGVWGWADNENKMIQDRKTFKFFDSPYLHATFLPRASKILEDASVVKRRKKLKYEIGNKFPLDYFYPEVLFRDRPNSILSPWNTMSGGFKSRAFIEGPLRKIKRRLLPTKIGY